MFRRKRNSSRAPLNPNPSPSAQTAATQAFLASQPSNANLSSAAAATALRTHTPTPTPIEDVQTKRMQRRSSSTSSRGIPAESLPDGQAKGLHRSGSSGSMTTRTFRDQSPGRPGSDRGLGDAPPVPPLPQAYPTKEPPRRRNSSMEPPYRATSPQMRHSAGCGGSLDRSVGRPPSGSPQSQRYSNLRSVTETERPDSRGSINFSYPTNCRSNSPRQSPILMDRPLRNEIPTNGMPNRDVVAAQYPAQPVDKPVKKKKKKKKAVGQGVAEGALAVSDTGKGPRGTTDSAQVHQVPQPREQAPPSSPETPSHALPAIDTEIAPKKKKKKKKKIVQDPQGQYVQGTETNPTPDSNRASPETHGLYDSRLVAPRPIPVPKKRPSVVREDPEGEEREEEASSTNSPIRHGANGSNLIPKTASTIRSNGEIPPQTRPEEAKTHTGQPSANPAVQSPSESARDHRRAEGHSDQGKQTGAEHTVDPQGGRQHSPSPSRSTRFSARLAVTSTGEALHEPPPRSVSPVKSAMKASHSPTSFSHDGSYHWPRSGNAQSETSEGTSAASEDGSKFGSKKKGFKVSFEDEAEVVGVSASPPTSPESSLPLSPQGKSTATRFQWHGIDRNKACFNDDNLGYGYDEVLKPRPALPSFGSVRGRRELPVEEDPTSDLHSDASSIASSISNLATVETSWSSDHAIGGILSEAKSRDTKEPSTTDHTDKAKEPIPPEVTSIEGTGYVSDSDVEVQPEGGPIPSIQHTSPPHSPTRIQNGVATGNKSNSPTDDVPSKDAGGDNLNGSIPLIAVLPATPALEDEGRSGGFPIPSNQPSQQSSEPETHTTPENTSPTSPDEMVKEQGSPVSASPEKSSLQEEDDSESDDSGESVYSDAAEDLSDLEGDGFGSINAIVESPITNPPNRAVRTPPESPSRSNFSQMKGTPPVEQRMQAVPQPATPELLPSALPVVQEEPTQFSKPKTKKKKKMASEASQPPAYSSPANFSHKDARPRAVTTGNNTKARRPASDGYEGPQLYQSFRHANGQPPSPSNAVQRNSSKPAPVTQPKATMLKKNTRPVSSGPVFQGSAASSQVASSRASFPDGLQRKLSNGSDSSSSFKRPKRRSKPDGRYTMRRTMRLGPGSGRPWSQDGENRGVRSLSPQSGRRPFSSSSNGSAMRMTMRGPPSSNIDKANDGKHAKSSSFAGFGKPSSLKKTQGKLGGSPKTKLSSRFNNGNPGEEDLSPSKIFRSRFDDSSDDEDFRPVRGIPRRKNTDDSDSTDLEDSSEDEAGRRAVPSGTRRRPGTVTGATTGSGTSATAAAAAANSANMSTTRPGSKHVYELDQSTDKTVPELEYFLPTGKKDKRPSFFHRLTQSKRNKNKDTRVHKSQLDSAARRDTSLERSRAELERMRLATLLADGDDHGKTQTTITGGDNTEQRGLHPSSSKLRKKPGGGNGTSKSQPPTSDSWPLRSESQGPPAPIPENTYELPTHQSPTPEAVADKPNTFDSAVKEDNNPPKAPAENSSSPATGDSPWSSRFRPRLHRRQGTDSTYDGSSMAASDTGGASATVGDVVVDKGGKRKKFPLLRRAFGLSG